MARGPPGQMASASERACQDRAPMLSQLDHRATPPFPIDHAHHSDHIAHVLSPLILCKLCRWGKDLFPLPLTHHHHRSALSPVRLSRHCAVDDRWLKTLEKPPRALLVDTLMCAVLTSSRLLWGALKPPAPSSFIHRWEPYHCRQISATIWSSHHHHKFPADALLLHEPTTGVNDRRPDPSLLFPTARQLSTWRNHFVKPLPFPDPQMGSLPRCVALATAPDHLAASHRQIQPVTAGLSAMEVPCLCKWATSLFHPAIGLGLGRGQPTWTMALLIYHLI
jgi:hypothetical protein